MSLLADLDIHTGRVIETVSGTHNSGDFIEFLNKVDAGYPPKTKIRLLLDPYLKRDASLPATASPTIQVRIHAQARFVVEHHRNPVQQNDVQHAPGDSRHKQAGTD